MPDAGASDRELVARFNSGEIAVFSTLHRRYYSKVYRLAYLHTHSEQDAEDIASETFCRAFQRIQQYEFRGCDSIYPWLHRVALNMCIDRCRDKAARTMVSLDAETADGIQVFLDRLEDGCPSPEELLERREVQHLVRCAIAGLPDDQHDAVVFRFLGELSLREIAETMHRTESSVKSLLFRGLGNLRAEILRRLSDAERIQLLGRRGETNVRGDSVRVRGRFDQSR